MKIAVGSDHGGYELKGKVIEFLKAKGHDVRDYGTHSKESCDYPLIGFDVAKAVCDGEAERGILICKTGVGMAIIANKLPGVRAAAVYDSQMASSSREHNDSNVISLAANYTDFKKAKEILKIWLVTQHVGERHMRRVRQIGDLEKTLKGHGNVKSKKNRS